MGDQVPDWVLFRRSGSSEDERRAAAAMWQRDYDSSVVAGCSSTEPSWVGRSGFVCSIRSGHDGPHVAFGGGSCPLLVWVDPSLAQETADAVFQEGYELGVSETLVQVGYLLCPYQYGLGTCSVDCRDEPECVTGGPIEFVGAVMELLARVRDGEMSVGEHEVVAEERRHRG